MNYYNLLKQIPFRIFCTQESLPINEFFTENIVSIVCRIFEIKKIKRKNGYYRFATRTNERSYH